MSKNTSSKPTKAASWNPWLGLLVAAFALLGTQIIASLVIASIVEVVRHWTAQQALNWLTSSIAAQFTFVLFTEISAVGLIYLYLKKYKGAFKEIGLRKPKASDPLYGLLGLPLYLAIYFVAVNISLVLDPSLKTNQKQQLGFSNASGGGELFLTFLSLVILPPIAEELIFRGLTYSSLKKRLPLWAAVIGTSLLFAAGHLPEGGSAGPLYIAAIDTFSLSLVLIYLREKTGGLWASMTLHALKNYIAFLVLFIHPSLFKL